MAIPDYQTVMLPLLRLTKDDTEHSLRDAIEKLAVQCQLSEDEWKELLPSGRQPIFENRVGWARTYLKTAGLLESTKRTHKGVFITTSSFSRGAVEYVSKIENKVVLIDGEQLSELMIDHNVGVSSVAAYEVKKIDSDYFAED